MAALGEERIEVCAKRRRDAQEVLHVLEQVIDKPMADWSDDEERKAQFSKANVCLDALRKALASLDAYERISLRACRKPSMEAPRRQRVDGSSLAVPSCSKLSADASQLVDRIAASKEDSSAQQPAAVGLWNWIMCCTSRPDVWDHEASVDMCVASMDRSIDDVRRGDILCCAPADLSIDAVHYYHAPGAEGSGGNPIYRGDRILLQGRRGAWAFNRHGWIPLWHPVSRHYFEASVLFIFDHHSTTFEDDESSSESGYSQGDMYSPRQSFGDSPRDRRRSSGQNCRSQVLHRQCR